MVKRTYHLIGKWSNVLLVYWLLLSESQDRKDLQLKNLKMYERETASTYLARMTQYREHKMGVP